MDLPEPHRRRLGVALVFVRMPSERRPPVRLADLVLRSVSAHFQHTARLRRAHFWRQSPRLSAEVAQPRREEVAGHQGLKALEREIYYSLKRLTDAWSHRVIVPRLRPPRCCRVLLSVRPGSTDAPAASFGARCRPPPLQERKVSRPAQRPSRRPPAARRAAPHAAAPGLPKGGDIRPTLGQPPERSLPPGAQGVALSQRIHRWVGLLRVRAQFHHAAAPSGRARPA